MTTEAEPSRGGGASGRGSNPGTGRHGFEVTFGTLKQELAYVADTVAGWLAAGVSTTEIGIAARTNSYADRIAEELRSRGIAVRALGDSTCNAVAVGTMHRMKGLEFR